MTSSMTGFARAEHESVSGKITIELRSVNHRYLDLTIRMPDQLRNFEGRVRETLQSRLARGKIDCNIHFKTATSAEGLQIDEALTKALLKTLDKVDGWMDSSAPVSADTILNWPGIIREDAPDKEAIKTSLDEAMKIALDTMSAMRAGEGQRMQAIIENRIEQITTTVKLVRERREEVLANVRKKLLDRLATLELEADSGRLEQELAFIAQKLDVDEELDRLDSHVEATRETLARKEAIGRRLDFIMQEFNREANTLSSKSADAETTAAAVELKVLIEQMREQVQNLE